MLMSRTLWVPIAAATVLVAVLLSAPAFAQAHIRGTLTAVKDGTISVQTAKGGTETIKLASDAGLFLVTTADMSAIQAGKFVGITSVEQDGKRVAREVHVFEESLRGLAEGHYPWDLESKPNMMTNANIAKIEEVGTDRVVKLNYSRGEQTITIPASATVVAFDKAPADQLAVGRKVFVVMKKDGSEAAAVVIGNSCLQFQLADEIAFSKRRAVVAENIVGRGRMEKEIRQRKRHQEAFRRERKPSVADLKGDIAANERVDNEQHEFLPTTGERGAMSARTAIDVAKALIDDGSIY